MGDRISIQFKEGKEVSPVFFSHWDGMGLLKSVQEYFTELKAEGKESHIFDPLDRREPGTVMVDFVRWLTQGKRVKSNYYLEVSENDGDNSDNGHFIVDTKSELIYKDQMIYAGASCKKCGTPLLGDMDSICGACAG